MLGLIARSVPNTCNVKFIFTGISLDEYQRFRGFGDNPQGKCHPYMPVSNNQESIIII